MNAPYFAYSGEAAREPSLRVHRLLVRLGLSAGHIFAWLSVFAGLYYAERSFEASLIGVSCLYALSQLTALGLTPLAGAALRHGIRRSLLWSTLFAVGAFASASLMFTNNQIVVAGLLVSFAICMGLHRALYWIPYQVALQRVPLLQSLPMEILISLMPLAAGVVMTAPDFGPAILFALVSALLILAMIAIARFSEKYEHFEWTYVDTWRALYSPFNRSSTYRALIDGFQGVALLFIWPIAAFIIVGQSFTALGLILSLTLLGALVGRIIMKKIFRRARVERSLPVAASFVFSTWLLRLTAATPIAVLVAEIMYHSGAGPKRYSVDAMIYDQVADGGHFVDEHTALTEMGMALGRILGIVFLVILTALLNASVALALCIVAAGMSAVFSLVISRRLTKTV